MRTKLSPEGAVSSDCSAGAGTYPCTKTSPVSAMIAAGHAPFPQSLGRIPFSPTIYWIFMVFIDLREPKSRILVHAARGDGVFDRQGSRKYLNSAERRAYLQAIKSEPDLARKAFCLTLFYTGCRISEALNLTAERIDLAGKAIVFETLKRRRRGYFRAVPIPGSLAALLTQMRGTMSHSGRVWDFSRATGYRLVTHYMAQARVAGGMACPKGLRHGVAVACLAQKIPLPTVQKWLGHARLETTAIYLDVSGEEERDLAKRLWEHSG